MEKSGKKPKKVKRNEVSGTGICEAELGGEGAVVEGNKSSEKENVNERKVEGIWANDKKKHRKKKRVREDNNKGNVGRESVNEQGEEIGEFDVGQDSDGMVVEKVRSKKKRGKGTAIVDSDHQLEEQHVKDAEAYVRSNVREKKKRKKGKKKDGVPGASRQDRTHLMKNSMQDNGTKSGKDFETFKVDKHVIRKEKKKRKREKGKDIDSSGTAGVAIVSENYIQDNANLYTNEKMDVEKKKGNKKGKRKEAKSIEKGFQDPKLQKSKKKVRFSKNVEVFPPSDDPNKGTGKSDKTLVRGKRFSQEEDEIVKQAVYNYIEAYGLGEEGVNMVLNCSLYPKIRNCWKEIATCLPYRPQSAVYYRAHNLFQRSETRKWTAEEYEMIRKFHEQHGNQWNVLADELGKHRVHVKDTWRRIRYTKLKKGHWCQEEYQSLFDLVNTDLRMKYSEEKKSKHGMLRDNICWTAISDKLSTRSDATCCIKWYNQLTSSMVAEGEWADADDYRLINALYELDASCSEDVDWDNLLPHRSGDLCRKRWNQMVLHIGHHGNKSFAEQVEVLAMRYCPDLIEVREAWDSKPVVP